MKIERRSILRRLGQVLAVLAACCLVALLVIYLAWVRPVKGRIDRMRSQYEMVTRSMSAEDVVAILGEPKKVFATEYRVSRWNADPLSEQAVGRITKTYCYGVKSIGYWLMVANFSFDAEGKLIGKEFDGHMSLD